MAYVIAIDGILMRDRHGKRAKDEEITLYAARTGSGELYWSTSKIFDEVIFFRTSEAPKDWYNDYWGKSELSKATWKLPQVCFIASSIRVEEVKFEIVDKLPFLEEDVDLEGK